MALCFSFAQSAPASFRIIWRGLVFIPTGRLSLLPSLSSSRLCPIQLLSFCRRATSFFFLSRHSLFTTYNNRGSSHSLPILERVPTKNLSTSRPRPQHRHRRNHKADISSSVIQQVGPSHVIVEPGWAFPFLATRRSTTFLPGEDQHLDNPLLISPSRVSFHPVATHPNSGALAAKIASPFPIRLPVFPYSRHLSTSGGTHGKPKDPVDRLFGARPP